MTKHNVWNAKINRTFSQISSTVAKLWPCLCWRSKKDPPLFQTVSIFVFVCLIQFIYGGPWAGFMTDDEGTITALPSSCFQPSRRRGDSAHHSGPIQQFGHHDRRWVQQTGRPRGFHPGSALGGRLSPGKTPEATQFKFTRAQVLLSHQSRALTKHGTFQMNPRSARVPADRCLWGFFVFFFREVATEWIIVSADEAAGVFSELPAFVRTAQAAKYEVKRIIKTGERSVE